MPPCASPEPFADIADMGGIFDLIRKVVRHPRLPAEIFGDFPFVCEEMRMGRRQRAGGGAERAAAHPVGNEIAPHGSAL
jgi:hypothetical protein